MKRAKQRTLPSRRPYVILIHPDTYTELIRDSEFARIYDKAIEHIAAVTMIPRELMQCPEWPRTGELVTLDCGIRPQLPHPLDSSYKR